jgi:two-component system cell cycle sensor histidine kinase/response regulator CckA
MYRKVPFGPHTRPLMATDKTTSSALSTRARDLAARHSAILEAALDCIITIDDQGHVLEFNPAAERTFGYTRDEALGQPIDALIIPPNLRSRHRRGLARFRESGEAGVHGISA